MPISYPRMISHKVRKAVGELTFVTAASRLGQKSVVYMPKGSSAERLENICAEGADVSITDLNYDDAVRLANRQAEIMTRPDLLWMKEILQMDKYSRVLLFSTEGDTDRKNYRRIVWDGKYPRE